MIWLLIITIAVLIFYKKPIPETSVLGFDSPIMPTPNNETLPENTSPAINVIYQEPVIVETSVLGVNSPIMSESGGTIIEETPVGTRVPMPEYNELRNLIQQ